MGPSSPGGFLEAFPGPALVVASNEDQLPEGLQGTDFAARVRAPADDEEPPKLSAYDVLTDDPLSVLSEVAGRAGVFSVIVPEIREHVNTLPRAVRRGYAKNLARPWLHARFAGFPAEEAMHLVAALRRLDSRVASGQLKLSSSLSRNGLNALAAFSS